MKLALHACCGPCLLEPYDDLLGEAEQITVVYHNPNIHPMEEYEHRRDTLFEYAAAAGIRAVELEYDPARWLEYAGAVASQPEERCARCYEIRFEGVAEWAVANGYDAFASTLAVSPYQNVEAIDRVGRLVAARHGLIFLERDFRERYREATRRSRELGMYRQNYCGCLMSDIEARQQRGARKAERQARKAARPEGSV